MARKKRASFRQIQNISLKDVDSARRSIPYLRKTQQQNIRDKELRGSKLGFVRQSSVASGDSGSLAQNEAALIALTLTANDANVIIAWPQINIYVDGAAGDRADLWFSGDNVSSTDASLQLGFTQHINTSARSGLASNQARMEGILTNRDSSSHTYSIFVRWLYLIVE